MKNIFVTVFAAAGLLAGAAMFTATVQAQGDLTAKVEERQKLMKAMGRSFGPMVAVVKGESTDFAAAGAAAQAMSDAMAKSATLFDAGSGAGDVPGSRANADVWAKADEFKAAADALIAASAKLAEVAKSSDVDAFKAQFGAVGKSCGGCHESKGDLGGKFRVPKAS